MQLLQGWILKPCEPQLLESFLIRHGQEDIHWRAGDHLAVVKQFLVEDGFVVGEQVLVVLVQAVQLLIFDAKQLVKEPQGWIVFVKLLVELLDLALVVNLGLLLKQLVALHLLEGVEAVLVPAQLSLGALQALDVLLEAYFVFAR